MRNPTPKPWYRPRNIIILLFLAFLALSVYVVFRGLTARPGSAVDYNQKLLDLVLAHQPPPDYEVENAWSLVEELRAKVEGVRADATATLDAPDANVFLDFTSLYTPDPVHVPEPGEHPLVTEDEQRRAADETASLQARRELARRALALMKERGVHATQDRLASARRAYRSKQEGIILLQVNQYLHTMRDLARANAARMHLAHAAGDHEEFAAAFEHCLTLGRVFAHQGTIIDRLVGIAIDALALRRLQEAIVAGGVPASTCRALLQAIDRQRAAPPLALQLEAERLMFLDLVQATHSDDGNGDGIRIPTALSRVGNSIGSGSLFPPTPPKIKDVLWFLYPGKAEVVARGNEIYDAFVAYAQTPRAARPRGASHPDFMTESLPKRHDLLRLLTPAVGSAVASEDRIIMELEGTRLLLAIEIFRQENARLPAALDELVPGLLPTLPADPLAPDGRFRYRVLDTPDLLGRSCLLYSVGFDGVDNQGATHPKGRGQALGSQSQVPCDYIINAPDEPQR